MRVNVSNILKGKAEDQLIKEVYMIKEKDEEQSMYRTRKRLLSQDDDGFLYALEQIDEQVSHFIALFMIVLLLLMV